MYIHGLTLSANGLPPGTTQPNYTAISVTRKIKWFFIAFFKVILLLLFGLMWLLGKPSSFKFFFFLELKKEKATQRSTSVQSGFCFFCFLFPSLCPPLSVDLTLFHLRKISFTFVSKTWTTYAYGSWIGFIAFKCQKATVSSMSNAVKWTFLAPDNSLTI